MGSMPGNIVWPCRAERMWSGLGSCGAKLYRIGERGCQMSRQSLLRLTGSVIVLRERPTLANMMAELSLHACGSLRYCGQFMRFWRAEGGIAVVAVMSPHAPPLI